MTIVVSYLNIKDSAATPSTEFVAELSTDSGNNTGWSFFPSGYWQYLDPATFNNSNTFFTPIVEYKGSITIEDALKEAYASAPSDVVILHTLEFRHPNFVDELNQPTSIRVVLDNVDHACKLESSAPLDPNAIVTFTRFSFDFTLPEVQSSATPEIIISMDNVSREIEDNLALAVASPYKVEVTYRPYLSTNVSAPQMDPPLTLTLTHVEADDFKVTARASYGDAANKAFPSELYTSTRFPGLIR